MYLLCISCDLVDRFPRRPGMLKFNNVLNKNTPAIGWHLRLMERVFPLEMNGNMFVNNQNKTALFYKKK